MSIITFFLEGGVLLLISKVCLYTHGLDEMKDFYSKTLGFELVDNNEMGFKIKAGDSELAFENSHSDKKAFYHFAFNISGDQFKEAKEWAKSKVTLTTEEGKDEIHFSFWNSDSFYFLDPAGNIVEFIARRAISARSESHFSVNNILNISEINVTTNDVLSAGNDLIAFGVPLRGNAPLTNDGLNFLGDNGAFLLLGPTKRRWIFSNKESEIHTLSIEIDKKKRIVLDAQGNIDCRYIASEEV